MGCRDLLHADVGAWFKRLLREPVSEPAYYPNFDLMRLFAASAVVVLHCHNQFLPDGTGWVGIFFAVPLFLALSGFLVLKSFSESKSWGRFAWKRCCRVVPAWIASFVLVGAFFGPHMVALCFHVWYTLGRDLPRISVANGPLWSLGWEELYYTILAILYLAGVYKRPALIVGLWPASLIAFEAVTPTDGNSWAELLPITVWALPACFLLGNLAYLFRSDIRRLQPTVALASGILGVIAYRMRPSDHHADFLFLQLMLAGLLIFAIAGPGPRRWKAPDLTYGTYIYHKPILVLLAATTRSWPVLLVEVSVCVVPLSTVSWFLLEKPCLKAKNVRFPWAVEPKGTAGAAVVEAA